MSDPFTRSQIPRQNLGSQFPGKAGDGTKSAGQQTGPGTDVASAYLKTGQPGGSKERLTNFLSKLETTWQMFNRSTLDADSLPHDGARALLVELEAPTPETLKRLREQLRQKADKPQKQSAYMYSGQTGAASKGKETPKPPSSGPKASPQSGRETPAPSRTRPQPTPRPETSGARNETPQRAESEAQRKGGDEAHRSSTERQGPRFEGPRVTPRPGTHLTSGSGGSVLGRKPGSARNAQGNSAQSAPKADGQAPKPEGQQRPEGRTSPQPNASRQPEVLRRGAPTPWTAAGAPTSRAYLGSSQLPGATLRHSDASGRLGSPSLASQLTRQPVFSQTIATISPRLTNRQVSSQMPVHSAFLDEHHEGEQGEITPLKLSWTRGKSANRARNQLLFSHRTRMQLFYRTSGQGRSLGNPITLNQNSSAQAAARSDVAGRIAGKAIGTLLKKLYRKEDLEELDEDTAVTSLGLILRLGGEFTYKHSTRVLDLALELADEVGIRDKQTRREIKYGTVLRDIGEFDLLLQSQPKSDQSLREIGDFLGGQDMLRAGLLHDIGKVQIPPEILYKPGKLTPEEYEIIKMHPIYGEEIVRPIASLRYLCPTIRGHHERWDGKGYPDGLSGEAIPLAARIISVADVFDALAAERPYKAGMEVQKVRNILAEGRGSHFDPKLVDAFLEIIARRYPDLPAE